jgi:Carboxypeptidase regulatory-like domain
MSVFAFPGKVKVVLSLFVVLVLSMAVVRRTNAQVAGATLSGTVTDGSGGVVPRAQITIKNVATGISTTTLTNSEGLYSAPNLLPGTTI